MERSLEIFRNSEFGEVRTYIQENGEPLFCLADICKVLELHNPSQVKTRLNQKGIQLVDLQSLSNEGVEINDLHIGNTLANFINESNVYRCITQSRKKEAEKFQDWLFDEVIPSIRKYGMYATAITIESIIANPEQGIKLLQALKDEQEKTMKLALVAEEQQRLIDAYQPKVVFAEAVIGSSTSILVGELAKILRQNGVKGMGQNRLFDWLRENEYLGKVGERYNIPNQRYIEQGLFELKTNTYSVNGQMYTRNTVKVTNKGCSYFINKFLGKNVLV